MAIGSAEGNIVTAFIKGAFDVVVAFIGRKRDKVASPGWPMSIQQPPHIQQSAQDAPRHTKPGRPTQIARITHREIRERLDSIAPFHRDAIEKSYVGMRVVWPIKFRSYNGTDSDVTIYGDVADTGSAIECAGRKDDFLCLVHAAEEEVIEIEGTVDLAGRAYMVLTDCTARRPSLM
jgi:hypothetical protein